MRECGWACAVRWWWCLWLVDRQAARRRTVRRVRCLGETHAPDDAPVLLLLRAHNAHVLGTVVSAFERQVADVALEATLRRVRAAHVFVQIELTCECGPAQLTDRCFTRVVPYARTANTRMRR